MTAKKPKVLHIQRATTNQAEKNELNRKMSEGYKLAVHI